MAETGGYFAFWGLYRQDDGGYIARPVVTIYPDAGMFEYRRMPSSK